MPEPDDFSEDDFACLCDAVTTAKDEQIWSAQRLSDRLHAKGWPLDTIRRTLVFWGDYERKKSDPA